MDQDVLRRGVAEFVGTFTLIFIGGGAGIVSGQDIVAVALANGLAIGIMVSNLGHISGGHFNPAITLGFLATRRITMPTRGRLLDRAVRSVRSSPPRSCARSSARAFIGAGPARGRLRRRQGLPARDDPHVLPRLGRLGDRRRPARRVQVDRRPRDRAHDHDRRLHGRPAHRRRDEPGARVRARSSLGNFWGEGWIYYLGPAIGALIAAFAYDYLYLRPTAAAPSSARPSPASTSRGPATQRSS